MTEQPISEEPIVEQQSSAELEGTVISEVQPVDEFHSLEDMIEGYSKIIDILETLGEERNAKVKEIMDPLRPVLDKIEQEYEDSAINYRWQHTMIEAMIKDQVLKLQSTVKSKRFMFVYNKGKKTWDGKRLEGYATAHPEILQLQNIGEPTVSIRKV